MKLKNISLVGAISVALLVSTSGFAASNSNKKVLTMTVKTPGTVNVYLEGSGCANSDPYGISNICSQDKGFNFTSGKWPHDAGIAATFSKSTSSVKVHVRSSNNLKTELATFTLDLKGTGPNTNITNLINTQGITNGSYKVTLGISNHGFSLLKG